MARMLSGSSFPRGLEVLVTSTQLSKQSNENGHNQGNKGGYEHEDVTEQKIW